MIATPQPPKDGLGTVISVLVGLVTLTFALWYTSDRAANPRPNWPPPADALALPADATELVALPQPASLAEPASLAAAVTP